MSRCGWAVGEEYERYHDEEWGVPSYDDRHLFEMLILEGAQAGLSWSTILNRRKTYRLAYRGFDPAVVACFTEKDVERLLGDPGIIRNRAKVRSSIANAQAFLKVCEEYGSFSAYQWRFVDGAPIQHSRKSLSEVPATSAESDAFSKDLKSRGFSFIGSTILYAYMQAVGMVNDHVVDCLRWEEVKTAVRR